MPRSVGLIKQDQMTLFFPGLPARGPGHSHLTHFAIQLVLNVVTHQLLTGVGYRAATGFSRGIGITALQVLLRLVAGIATTHRTRNSRQFLAVTSAHLVTEQATHHSTNRRTGYLVLVLDRCLTSDRHVLADFPRGFDSFLDRFNGQHFGIFRRTDEAVSSHGSTRRHTHRPQYRAHQHRLIHTYLLETAA